MVRDGSVGDEAQRRGGFHRGSPLRGCARLWGCCRRHRRNEAVTEFRHRFDETRALLTLAQRPADEPDVFRQIGLIDEAARP
jgi:hypothetical protein